MICFVIYLCLFICDIYLEICAVVVKMCAENNSNRKMRSIQRGLSWLLTTLRGSSSDWHHLLCSLGGAMTFSSSYSVCSIIIGSSSIIAYNVFLFFLCCHYPLFSSSRGAVSQRKFLTRTDDANICPNKVPILSSILFFFIIFFFCSDTKEQPVG